MLDEDLKKRASKLGFHALVSRWEEFAGQPWLRPLLADEEIERDKRSLETRIKDARLGNFKPMSEFDWSYPSRIDRELVEELLTLKFLVQHSNVVLLGANGLGKTMIAKGIGHQALLNGYKARFVTASHMLGELAACDGASSRDRCFKKYAGVDLLILDEVGYLSYDNRFADLLYEVVTARYEKLSTIVTTNRPFKEWGDIFPNAACVVTLVDRLMHNCEIVLIEAQRSYRHKEAEERSEEKQRARKAKTKDAENKKERGRQK